MVTDDDNTRRTMTSAESDDDGSFVGYKSQDLACPGKASWAHDSSIERGAEPKAMNTSIATMGHSPNTFRQWNGIHTVQGTMQSVIEQQEDLDNLCDLFHDALPFPTSYDLEPSDMTGKKIRFSDIIATDMEAISWLRPHSSLDVPFASEQADSSNSFSSIDPIGQETTLETADEVDQDEDASSQKSEESEDEDTRIRQQLWYAVSGAGVVALLGWTSKKILQMFHRRVEEEEDDRVAGGGDVWGANPISEHLQIKEVAKGMFVNQGNKGSPSHTVSGLYVAAAESGSLNPAAVQQ